MAEKYGTIPKKFTRDWWSYFWMYYKWHTISIIFIMLVVGFSVYSSITAEKYDLTLTYAGKLSYSDEKVQKLENALSPLCPDIDKNGEGSVLFSQLNIDYDTLDYEYLMAMVSKLDMAFIEDNAYIYILDEKNADRYKGEAADEVAFAPLEDWITADISGMNTYMAHGKKYGVDISNIEIFKDLGIDMSNHYLFVRYYPRRDQIKKQFEGYNAAIDMANKMLLK